MSVFHVRDALPEHICEPEAGVLIHRLQSSSGTTPRSAGISVTFRRNSPRSPHTDKRDCALFRACGACATR